ncbi:MAG TPA: Flp family type IVb pilin [Xanthobacteraceae bacterium]|jgi:pilus assembly protein Flp/PilA
MKLLLERFAHDDSAASTVVYGLLAAGMAMAIITVVSALGSKLNITLHWVQAALQ